MIIEVRAEDLRNPSDSKSVVIAAEGAADCDGSECLELFYDEYGEAIDRGPHHHLIVTGQDPPTSPHRFAIWSK